MLFENLRIKDVHSILHYAPNIKKWSAKNRKNHFIGIMLNGSTNHKFKNQSFVLSGNCIYFFNQKDDYEAEVYEAGNAFSVHFTTYEDIETDSFSIQIDNPYEIISLLQKAEQLSCVSGNGDLSLLSTLYKLCDVFTKARQKTYFQKDMRMHIAKDYIDTNFKDADCIKYAIKQCGLSSRRFCDLFKCNFGTTPNKHLVQRRIVMAKSMLETKSLTISEVAELCGFSDVYYFSKVFKQECGVSPSKWK